MITQHQAVLLIERSRRHGYVQGICAVHEVLLSYAQHATEADVELLEALGRAIIEIGEAHLDVGRFKF